MQNFFKNTGFRANGVLNITPKDTLALCSKGAIILDVREDYMNRFKMFDVPEVIYCPQSIIQSNIKNLPVDKALIIADAVGLRSKEVTDLLISKEFKNVANLAGGMVEWERDGYPIVIDKTQRLTGSCMCQLKRRDK